MVTDQLCIKDFIFWSFRKVFTGELNAIFKIDVYNKLLKQLKRVLLIEINSLNTFNYTCIRNYVKSDLKSKLK